LFTEIQERNRLLTEAEHKEESNDNSDPRPGKKPKNSRSFLSDEENNLIQELDDTSSRARSPIDDDIPSNKSIDPHNSDQEDQEDEAAQNGIGVQDHESDSFMSNGVILYLFLINLLVLIFSLLRSPFFKTRK
jgi:hypothetical protein